jgi:hypothetical protein
MGVEANETMDLQYAPVAPLRRGRWLVTLAFVLGLPASGYLGRIIAGPLADFLVWHGLFCWAYSSFGDIGQRLMLGLGGALVGLFGWILGIFAPVRSPKAFLRYGLVAAGVPTLIILLACLSLTSRGSFEIAALGCVCIAFSTLLLTGASVRGGLERLRDRLCPAAPHYHQKLPYLILITPIVMLAVGLVTLHFVHMHQVAEREPSCIAFLQSVAAAEAKYYETHKTPGNLDAVLNDSIAGVMVPRRIDGYRLHDGNGGPTMLFPESAGPYQPIYWLTYPGGVCTISRGVHTVGSRQIQEQAITTAATRRH